MRKMVSQWRYRCACYRTARHASAPAAHATQSLSASLPVDARCLPAAQSTHAVADNGVAAYFPAPHATQSASPSLAVCLPAHRQRQKSAYESAASRALSEIPPPHVEVHRCMHVSLRNGIAHAILRETEGHAGADAGISEMQVQR